MFNLLKVGVLIVLLIFILALCSDPKSSKKKSVKQDIKIEQTSEQITKQKTDPKIEYIKRVDMEIKSLKKPDLNYKIEIKTQFDLTLHLAIFHAWAVTINDAKKYDLSESELKKVSELKKLVIARQMNRFPKIRDKYGPFVRGVLWELDASAKTIGNRFTTIQYTGSIFLPNANKKEWNKQNREVWNILRIKQVRYKWLEEDSEYTYFNIDSPKDSDIIIWKEGGRFIKVK